MAIAKESEFVKRTLSDEIRTNIFAKLDSQIHEYLTSKDKDSFEDKYYFKSI